MTEGPKKMHIVTGGAGFIGSAIVSKLNREGIDDILIVDQLGSSDKWKNLRNLFFTDYIHKDAFLEKIQGGGFGAGISAIIHMGACSATTERDADYLFRNNFHYTRRIPRRFRISTAFLSASAGSMPYSLAL